jgi:hypothetical protein
VTRQLLLQHLLHQARGNGLELRRWFRTDAALPWPGGDAAVDWLSQGRRINLLLLSHSFARAFFAAEDLRQIQPSTTYQRTAPNGVTRTITRRAHTRKTRNHGAWQYHLAQMALAPDPLLYAQRFLISAEAIRRSAKQPAPAPMPAPPPDYDDELLVRP